MMCTISTHHEIMVVTAPSDNGSKDPKIGWMAEKLESGIPSSWVSSPIMEDDHFAHLTAYTGGSTYSANSSEVHRLQRPALYEYTSNI